jgi:hypothetical protein
MSDGRVDRPGSGSGWYSVLSLPGRLFVRDRAGVDYSRAALTSMNSSGVTLQAADEEAFQVAPSA